MTISPAGHHLMPQLVRVDCLLPNGVIVELRSQHYPPLVGFYQCVPGAIGNFPWTELKRNCGRKLKNILYFTCYKMPPPTYLCPSHRYISTLSSEW